MRQGQASNRRIAGEIREQVLGGRLPEWHEFGPTFASQQLAKRRQANRLTQIRPRRTVGGGAETARQASSPGSQRGWQEPVHGRILESAATAVVAGDSRLQCQVLNGEPATKHIMRSAAPTTPGGRRAFLAQGLRSAASPKKCRLDALFVRGLRPGQPGTVIESFSVVDATGPIGSSNPPILIYSVLQPLLSAGTPYSSETPL
jgi:hypothetical protein